MGGRLADARSRGFRSMVGAAVLRAARAPAGRVPGRGTRGWPAPLTPRHALHENKNAHNFLLWAFGRFSFHPCRYRGFNSSSTFNYLDDRLRLDDHLVLVEQMET